MILIYDLHFHSFLGMKIKSRVDFEEDFDDIKHLITGKTLFAVGDKIKQFEEVKKNVTNRRCQLRDKNGDTDKYNEDHQGQHDNNERREKILEELITTEEAYVDDLNTVLYGYRDRLDEEGEEFKLKADVIFGNMEEIFEFHSQVRFNITLQTLQACDVIILASLAFKFYQSKKI